MSFVTQTAIIVSLFLTGMMGPPVCGRSSSRLNLRERQATPITNGKIARIVKLDII
jgi:hypothetical protein